MIRTLTAAIVGLAATCGVVHGSESLGRDRQTPASAVQDIQIARACGWYIFVGCARSYQGAMVHAGNGLDILRTSDYPLLRPGWYCAAIGPYRSRPPASEVAAIKRDVPDAYAKRAC